MKRKFSETSHEAHESMKPVILDHHARIIAALDEIGEAIYEKIAIHCGWDDKNRASRRLAELERLGIVEKTGAKLKTSSGRSAFVYKLTPPPKKAVVAQSDYVQVALFP